jgi:hypothetical protein
VDSLFSFHSWRGVSVVLASEAGLIGRSERQGSRSLEWKGSIGTRSPVLSAEKGMRVDDLRVGHATVSSRAKISIENRGSIC